MKMCKHLDYGFLGAGAGIPRAPLSVVNFVASIAGTFPASFSSMLSCPPAVLPTLLPLAAGLGIAPPSNFFNAPLAGSTSYTSVSDTTTVTPPAPANISPFPVKLPPLLANAPEVNPLLAACACALAVLCILSASALPL